MTPQERSDERLTASQRAEKILASVRDAHPGFPRSFQEDVDMIAAQIEEALKQDRAEHNQRVEEVRKEIWAEGFNTAKEQAAKIAMDFKYGDQNSGYEIAEVAKQIRAMSVSDVSKANSPEGEKKL